MASFDKLRAVACNSEELSCGEVLLHYQPRCWCNKLLLVLLWLCLVQLTEAGIVPAGLDHGVTG